MGAGEANRFAGCRFGRNRRLATENAGGCENIAAQSAEDDLPCVAGIIRRGSKRLQSPLNRGERIMPGPDIGHRGVRDSVQRLRAVGGECDAAIDAVRPVRRDDNAGEERLQPVPGACVRARVHLRHCEKRASASAPADAVDVFGDLGGARVNRVHLFGYEIARYKVVSRQIKNAGVGGRDLIEPGADSIASDD
ncbi:MAG: hypothetical protein JMDDDDMK_02351 [Acidobacteria bacterium]|nr:hypothetical protein [Acidobacteriota bacterium]